MSLKDIKKIGAFCKSSVGSVQICIGGSGYFACLCGINSLIIELLIYLDIDREFCTVRIIYELLLK